MFGTHIVGLGQVLLRHWIAFDICALARLTLLEYLWPFTSAGIQTVGLGAHGAV